MTGRALNDRFTEAVLRALLMHNAYHLGEIRQALCTLRPDR